MNTLQVYAVNEAQRLGLYVLFERQRGQPVWRIYDATTGDLVLMYYPRDRKWLTRNDARGEGDARAALNAAAEMVRADRGERQPA